MHDAPGRTTAPYLITTVSPSERVGAIDGPDTIATPDRKKPIYEVFRLADTPDWKKAFNFALPIVGIKDWNEIDPK